MVVVAVIVIALVVLSVWWSFKPAPAPPPGPGPAVVLLVPNGTRMSLPPGGFHAIGPTVVPSNHSVWTVTSGIWWQSNGTTDCLMTVGFYGTWNKAVAPSNCDGFTYYGSPNISGYYAYGNIGIRPGSYYAVWYNLSPNEGTTVNVTAPIEVSAWS